jgi:hypothetical protein
MDSEATTSTEVGTNFDCDPVRDIGPVAPVAPATAIFISQRRWHPMTILRLGQLIESATDAHNRHPNL